jgi:hypothetical protein
MTRKDSHPSVLKRVEYRFRQSFYAQMKLDLRMDQYVHSAPDSQYRKAIGTNARGLSFVDESGSRLFHCIGDGCRFSVIQRCRCRPDNKLGKILRRNITKTNDFHEANIHKLVQAVEIVSSVSAACIEFSRYNIHHH